MNSYSKKNINMIDVLLIGFFFLFSTLSFVIVKNPIIRIVIEWSGFFIISLKITKNFKLYKFDSLLLIFIILVIIEMILNFSNSFFSICLMLPFLLLPLFSKNNISYINKLFDVFLGFVLIYALFTIFFSFNSVLYNNFVLKFYPQSSDLLIFWYKQRCNAGLVSHYTTNGILMITGIIILFSKILEKDSSIKNKKKYFIEFIILVIGLLLTGKRAQLIFGLLSLLLGYFIFLSNKKKSRLFKIFGVLITILTVGLILYNLFPSLFTFVDRFIQTTNDGDVTLGRKKYWNLAINIFKENKIFGIGWGNFKLYSFDLYSKNADVHNNYLQLLCELGIIGFSVFIAMALTNLYRTIKIYSFVKKNSLKIDNKSLLLFAVCYQVFFLLYCFIGNPLYTNVVYIPYFLTYSIVDYFYFKYMKGDFNE